MTRPKRLNVSTQRRGLALVEMAIVLPLLLAILLGIIEAGSVLFVRHNMLNAAREATRSLAIQEADAAEAEQIALAYLADINLVFTIVVTLPDPANPDDRTMAVQITTPLREASAGDPWGIFETDTLSAKVTMRREG